jgi:predicted phage-related endonuclease
MSALMQVMSEAEPDRRSYLGGSDAAAIMGVGAYGRTPLACYRAKVGESVEVMDAEKRRFLERRKRWEGPIFEMLREEFDAEIVAINRRLVDPEFDFMAAEIDFEWIDSDGSIQNGEVKTVSPFAFGERAGWGEAGSSDIPVHYAAQVMWGLMVTGRRTCIVGAMIGLDSFVFYRVERDEETIAAMRAAALDFWREHVLKRLPPEPISLADVLSLTIKMVGKPTALDATALESMRKIKLIRDSKKAMDTEIEELEFLVFDFIRQAWALPTTEADQLPTDNAILTFAGQPVGTWARQRGASLDQKRLKSERPEIVAAFTKEHFFRTLRFTRPA